jgi:hypothetical protein
VRVIEIPGEKREDVLHVAVLSREHKGVDKISHLTVFFFRYKKHSTSGKYEDDDWAKKDLEYLKQGLMSANTRSLTHRIKEFNVLFHNTAWFYIEITQVTTGESLENDEYNTKNSHLVSFANTDSLTTGVMLLSYDKTRQPIKDKEFFDMMAHNEYKMCDYRRNTGETRLFDCIFFKSINGEKACRFVLYKASDGVAQPKVAFIRHVLRENEVALLDMLSPEHDTPKLFYFSLARRSLADNVRVTSVQFKVNTNLVAYEKDYDIALSASLKYKLSFSAPLPLPHCILCGHDDNVNEDELSGNIYCDTSCQYIFCKTRAL